MTVLRCLDVRVLSCPRILTSSGGPELMARQKKARVASTDVPSPTPLPRVIPNFEQGIAQDQNRFCIAFGFYPCETCLQLSTQGLK